MCDSVLSLLCRLITCSAYTEDIETLHSIRRSSILQRYLNIISGSVAFIFSPSMLFYRWSAYIFIVVGKILASECFRVMSKRMEVIKIGKLGMHGWYTTISPFPFCTFFALNSSLEDSGMKKDGKLLQIASLVLYKIGVLWRANGFHDIRD